MSALCSPASVPLTTKARRIPRMSSIFRSCIFMPCELVLHFQVLHSPVLHFQRTRSDADCPLTSSTSRLLLVRAGLLHSCMSAGVQRSREVRGPHVGGHAGQVRSQTTHSHSVGFSLTDIAATGREKALAETSLITGKTPQVT